MRENEAEYLLLNPEHGWVPYYSAVALLVSFHGACLAHPKALISVCK